MKNSFQIQTMIRNKIISKTFWVINIVLISSLMVTGFIEHSYSAESLKPGESVDSYFKQGNAYLEEGQYEKAIANYTGAIEIKPGYADAIFNRGSAYSKSGRLDKSLSGADKNIQVKRSMADINRAIEIDPKNTSILKTEELLSSTSKDLPFSEEGRDMGGTNGYFSTTAGANVLAEDLAAVPHATVLVKYIGVGSV